MFWLGLYIFMHYYPVILVLLSRVMYFHDKLNYFMDVVAHQCVIDVVRFLTDRLPQWLPLCGSSSEVAFPRPEFDDSMCMKRGNLYLVLSHSPTRTSVWKEIANYCLHKSLKDHSRLYRHSRVLCSWCKHTMG